MVGLGVGIDYALLLVTRFAEFLQAGHDKVEAAGRAVATAGRSVVFASATVLVSLLGLKLAGLPTYDAFGYATAIAVVGVASAALTLVPALCGLAGRRLLPRKVRKAGRAPKGSPLMARWATRVGRRPLAWALLAVDRDADAGGTRPGDAHLAAGLLRPAVRPDHPQGLRPGRRRVRSRRQRPDHVRAPTGIGDAGVTALAKQVAVARRHRRGLAGRSPPPTARCGSSRPSRRSARPTSARPAWSTTCVPRRRRASRSPAPLRCSPTSPTCSATRLWLVVGFVVAVSMLLLGMVFRSVVVPVKAAVMNLLSIGAAYGVLTAIFQWGWGADLLGLDHSMPVSSWMPILLFAVLFGLSMDYEVFLLSRIREDWLDTGDAHGSVVRGLSATGRVISAAAAIMVAVFLGFASEVDVVVKQLGVGMAVAIAARRDPGPDGPRARHDDDARQVELVDAGVARPGPAHRPRRGHRPRRARRPSRRVHPHARRRVTHHHLHT